MTVKELIEELQEMDQELEVICVDDDENEYNIDNTNHYVSYTENQVIIGISRS